MDGSVLALTGLHSPHHNDGRMRVLPLSVEIFVEQRSLRWCRHRVLLVRHLGITNMNMPAGEPFSPSDEVS